MRPSRNKQREALRQANAEAVARFVAEGGEIKFYGPDCYLHEGVKLSRKELSRMHYEAVKDRRSNN